MIWFNFQAASKENIWEFFGGWCQCNSPGTCTSKACFLSGHYGQYGWELPGNAKSMTRSFAGGADSADPFKKKLKFKIYHKLRDNFKF